MFNWIKKIAVKWAIKLMRNELIVIRTKNPKAGELVDNLYGKSLSAFMTWGMSELGKGDKVYTQTPIELLKETLEPLRDDIEGIIVQVIDGLNPRM